MLAARGKSDSMLLALLLLIMLFAVVVLYRPLSPHAVERHGAEALTAWQALRSCVPNLLVCPTGRVYAYCRMGNRLAFAVFAVEHGELINVTAFRASEGYVMRKAQGCAPAPIEVLELFEKWRSR